MEYRVEQKRPRWDGKTLLEILDMAIAEPDRDAVYILSGIVSGTIMKDYPEYRPYLQRLWEAGHGQDVSKLREILREMRAEIAE
jgi:hypothetical protein